MDETTPVHPAVVELLEQVEFGGGAAARLPRPVLVKWRRQLGQRREERLLFEHLVVMWSRLGAGGLPQLAGQCLELARIGLEPTALEKTVQDIDRISRQVGDAPLKRPGAAMAPPRAGGVSLRGRKRR